MVDFLAISWQGSNLSLLTQIGFTGSASNRGDLILSPKQCAYLSSVKAQSFFRPLERPSLVFPDIDLTNSRR